MSKIVPNILICEDDDIVIAIFQVRLRHAGYNILIAPNGKAGLDILDENPNIDLIISDLIMPEMGGLEFITEVRSRKFTMPILVISALAEMKIVEEAYSLGANDFITKPFKPDEIVIRIKNQLR